MQNLMPSALWHRWTGWHCCFISLSPGSNRETENRDISLNERELRSVWPQEKQIRSSLVVCKRMFTSAFLSRTETANWWSESGDRFYGLMDELNLKASLFLLFSKRVEYKHCHYLLNHSTPNLVCHNNTLSIKPMLIMNSL